MKKHSVKSLQAKLPTNKKSSPHTVAPQAKQVKLTADAHIHTMLNIGWSSAVASRIPDDFKKPGWRVVRLDNDAQVKPDFLASILDMSVIADNSVDFVWCPYVLQHLHSVFLEKALRECFRILKEGGKILISVPDGQLAATYVAHGKGSEEVYRSPAGAVIALDILYGFGPNIIKGNNKIYNHNALDAKMLGLAVRGVGFTNIKVKQQGIDIIATAVRYAFEHPDRVERLEIISGSQKPEAPAMPAKIDNPTIQQPHPGWRQSPNMQYDELDQPPFYWKANSIGKI